MAHISARMVQGTTMTSDHTATMTYVMCREEHLWDVGVLQREHLPSLVNNGNHGIFLVMFKTVQYFATCVSE
jgi:hypothetical protein